MLEGVVEELVLEVVAGEAEVVEGEGRCASVACAPLECGMRVMLS